jgi:hypothetical protein
MLTEAIKDAAAGLCLNPDHFGAHSLRGGGAQIMEALMESSADIEKRGGWAKDSQAMRKVYVQQAIKHASRGPLRALDEASKESASKLISVQTLKVAAAVRNKVFRG